MEPETLQAELIAALRKRLEVIGDRALRESDPARQLDELRKVSGRIEELQRELPAATHPQLLHYFERCSYDKALAWLEEEGLSANER
jgi:hypothetical protein